jgi:hypothetical protein
MWTVREESIQALKVGLKEEGDMISEGFSIIDEMIQKFNDLSPRTDLSTLSGLLLVKGKNLCFGMYSLALDGLAQESGALLRPTIECIELVQFFYDDQERLKLVFENKVPSAGEVAKAVNGKFKKLREFLNENASHLSISIDSLMHLIDWTDRTFKPKQKYSETVLRKNLSTLFYFISFLIVSTVNCLDKCGCQSETLVQKINQWRDRGQKISRKNHGIVEN